MQFSLKKTWCRKFQGFSGVILGVFPLIASVQATLPSVAGSLRWVGVHPLRRVHSVSLAPGTTPPSGFLGTLCALNPRARADVHTAIQSAFVRPFRNPNSQEAGADRHSSSNHLNGMEVPLIQVKLPVHSLIVPSPN